jgi:ABC-type dipeptide/oligopeptide/nickel transport system permease component
VAGFLLRRLGQLAVVVVGGFTLLFLLFFAAPSDPAEIIASGNGKAAPAQVVENVRVKYGFDKPLYEQYWNRLTETVTLSGESIQTKEPVSDIVAERLPNSIRLATAALTIEVIFGIGFGVLSATRRNSALDWVTTTAAVVAGAIPVFVLGFLLKQVTGVYAYQHGWPDWARFPAGTIGPDTWVLWLFPTWSELKYLIQPAIILASVSTAIVARITRSSMLESGTADYVRTARSKGLDEGTIRRKHVLRNALIPVVTYVGVDFGTLIGFAILTETVFSWPGLGSKVATAAAQRDLPVVLTLSTIVIVVYGVANLLVDISYAYLDPRIRRGAD